MSAWEPRSWGRREGDVFAHVMQVVEIQAGQFIFRIDVGWIGPPVKSDFRESLTGTPGDAFKRADEMLALFIEQHGSMVGR